MIEFAYPFLGMAVVVTLGFLFFSMYLAVTVKPEDVKISKKTTRHLWWVGRICIGFCVAVTAALVLFAIGKSIAGWF